MASFNKTVIAPAIPNSFTVNGQPSNRKPRIIFSIRRFRSSMSFAKQRIAIISDAGVISKPDSSVIPFVLGPKPVTILRKERSFTSSTRRHRIKIIVEQCGYHIVRRSDGMKISCKVQIYLFHRKHLGITATCCPPLHAETRS